LPFIKNQELTLAFCKNASDCITIDSPLKDIKLPDSAIIRGELGRADSSFTPRVHSISPIVNAREISLFPPKKIKILSKINSKGNSRL
jgi:hypothetical protein